MIGVDYQQYWALGGIVLAGAFIYGLIAYLLRK